MNNSYPSSSGLGAWSARAGRFFLALLLDIVVVVASYALALYLKFDTNVPEESWRQLAWAGPLIAFAYILAYQLLGVYRTAWQYGSVRDAFMLAIAVGVVTLAILCVNVLLPKRPIPLTVNVISAAFIFLFHGVTRMLPRLWNASGGSLFVESQVQQRVLIVGAGDTGQLLAWELQHNHSQPYRAVGFIDDDSHLRGKRVHGIPVAGSRYDIPSVIEQLRVDLVAIALPPTVAPGLQEILALCEPSQVPVRLVPGVSEIMEGRAQRGEMREITMEDLLAREAVAVDEVACCSVIEGRVIMVTGAGGSIGTELCRRVAAMKPAMLHLLDINETALYELRNELRQAGLAPEQLKAWLCSITDRPRLEDVFEVARPQVVFHLAAYKIVTMMEEHPDQAFEVDVAGTLNVFEVAQQVQAEKVLFLSSHTAVNPVSVYGAAKRVGELLVTSMPKGRSKFAAVRLTNVIDAKGSVLGVFSRQIQNDAPLSVTDPEVARYFLTISEVAGLVIQSAALMSGGEVYILDVGEEVRIADLAERLVRLHGKDLPINITGLRPGEKLRESLIGEHEMLVPTDHSRLLSAVSSLSFAGNELRAGIRELEVDRRRRAGNLPARLHALARIDRATETADTATSESVESPREP